MGPLQREHKNEKEKKTERGHISFLLQVRVLNVFRGGG
jgi:hypothetical protein